ncbi:hypothetical protein FQN55_000351 [Onygenales sp. PD_40]|nr:hypothetical protein FQN55_000351 [Onygenales sp. PD_40]
MSTTTMNSMRTPAAAVPTHRPTPAWDNPSSPRSMRPPLSTFERRLSSSERGVPQSPGTPATPSSQSGPWSAHDDEVLLSARAQGLGWNQIQRENFQIKTPNACRKRFERLVQKRKGAEWEGERVEKVAKVYSQMRSDIWRPLAEATGESWEDVERLVCCTLSLPNNVLPFAPIFLVWTCLSKLKD